MPSLASVLRRNADGHSTATSEFGPDGGHDTTGHIYGTTYYVVRL